MTKLTRREMLATTAATGSVAYFIGHANQSNVLVPMLNQGELAVLYCFVFLYFAVAGAGSWSLDSMLRSRKSV